MVRPLMLLDVDGVLNALGRGDHPAWPRWRLGRASAGGSTWPIRWAEPVAAEVRRWVEDDLAEVQWLTTWGHDAPRELAALLQLPPLAVAGTYDDGAGEPGEPDGAVALAGVTPAARDELTGRWWNFDVVRQVLRDQPGRRLVWLDDDLAGEDDIRAWVGQHADALLVAPDPLSGLNREDLQRVRVALDRWAGGA